MPLTLLEIAVPLLALFFGLRLGMKLAPRVTGIFCRDLRGMKDRVAKDIEENK